ncbi:MAG: hypothetical protein PWQ31_1511, partial [Eubacteriales bacterium]|nr:hypothetical protein [Eubacteriales bacterium]
MRTQWLVKVKLPLFTIDLVSYIIACFLAYKIRFGFASDLMLDDVQRLMAVLMGLIWIMIGLTEHGLKRYDEWEKLADLKDLFYKVALLFLTTVTVLFLFKIDASRLFISYVHAILFIVAFVNRRVGRRLIKRSLKNGLRAYLLFIGPADKVKKIAG